MPLTAVNRGDRLLIVRGQIGEIEPAGEHLLGEAAHIGDLLPGQAGGAQVLVAGPRPYWRDPSRRRSAPRAWARSRRPRRPDLLADDRAQHGVIAGLADARLGHRRPRQRRARRRARSRPARRATPSAAPPSNPCPAPALILRCADAPSIGAAPASCFLLPRTSMPSLTIVTRDGAERDRRGAGRLERDGEYPRQRLRRIARALRRLLLLRDLPCPCRSGLDWQGRRAQGRTRTICSTPPTTRPERAGSRARSCSPPSWTACACDRAGGLGALAERDVFRREGRSPSDPIVIATLAA